MIDPSINQVARRIWPSAAFDLFPCAADHPGPSDAAAIGFQLVVKNRQGTVIGQLCGESLEALRSQLAQRVEFERLTRFSAARRKWTG